MQKKTILLVVNFILTFALFNTHVLAQTPGTADIGPLASAESRGLCGGDALSSLFCNKSLAEMLNSVFQLSIQAGALLALLRISYSGYLYMGNDIWSTKQHAKDVFRDAIVGLLLLLAIWLILFQINPCILDLSVLQSGKSTCGAASQTAPALPAGQISA